MLEILFFTTLLFPTFAVGEGSQNLERAVRIQSCDDVLRGLKEPKTTILDLHIRNKSKSQDHKVYETKTYFIPKDRIGTLIRAVVVEGINTQIFSAVEKFPKYFAQFDIYANPDTMTVILPDGNRLTGLVKNGIRYFDIPRQSANQKYSEDFFRKKIIDGVVPLASEGYLFHHDRLEDHMMGALIVPNWLFEKVVKYAKFEEAFLTQPNETSTRNHSSGALWDDMTSRLGTFVGRLKTTVQTEDIDRLAYLLEYFSITYSTNEICDANKSFFVEEAVRIVHEVTGVPIEELKAKSVKPRDQDCTRS